MALTPAAWSGLLRGAGIGERTVAAIASVNRVDYLPDGSKHLALEPAFSAGLPTIAHLTPWDGASKSPPIGTHAQALNLLDVQPGDRVLEVGSGSSYTCALMRAMGAGEVLGVDACAELVEMAADSVADVDGVEVMAGDGIAVALDAGPWDRILVSCGAPRSVPAILGEVLSPGGRAVVAVSGSPGHRTRTRWIVADRDDDGAVRESRGPITALLTEQGRWVSGRFLPLLGAHGHHIEGARHVDTVGQHRRR